eukprot:gene10352-biopygen1966
MDPCANSIHVIIDIMKINIDANAGTNTTADEMDGDDGLSTARTLANEVKLLRMQGRVHEAAA